MIPAAFTYRRAASLEHALRLLGEADDPWILAGGHSLVPAMKLRKIAPGTLVDIGRLDSELAYVKDSGDHLAVGALTRYRDVAASEMLARIAPPVAHACTLIGDTQVRCRGTIGGSLVFADPAADLPGIVVALDAVLVLVSPQGERIVSAQQFFTGAHTTERRRDEILREIRFPKPDLSAWAYQRFTRRSQDWPTVAVTAVRTAKSTAVALCNMAATPLRARAVERALAAGAGPEAAAELADRGSQPVSDAKASAAYRRHLVRVLTRRALLAIAPS